MKLSEIRTSNNEEEKRNEVVEIDRKKSNVTEQINMDTFSFLRSIPGLTHFLVVILILLLFHVIHFGIHDRTFPVDK